MRPAPPTIGRPPWPWPERLALARKSQSAVLAALAQAKLKEAESIKADFDKIKDRIAALAANLDDPAANLAVGRFRCLIKQEASTCWPKGPAAH